MPDGIDLAAAAATGEEGAPEQDGPQEVPSVFSVITRYLVGAADVSPPSEDGSRVVRLVSGNGQTVIEANLSPQLCTFISEKLVAVEVIEQGDEEKEESD